MALRHATQDDLPRIVEIYNSSIPGRMATADTDCVTVADRQEWFSRHAAGKRPLLVHELNGEIIGWISFEPFYGRPAYRHTAEVSIYIADEYRGRGLGGLLLTAAIQIAAELNFRTLVGYVFAHNEPSIRLLRRFGFSEWGRLPDVAEMDGREYSLCILGRRL